MESSRSAVVEEAHDSLSNPESTVHNIQNEALHEPLISTHALVLSPCSLKYQALKNKIASLP